MKVALTDKTEFYIDSKEASALEDELLKSNEGFVIIAGRTIRKKSISSIMPGDLPATPSDALQIEEKRCVGKKSIQKEINEIAKSYDNWGKLTQDKQWREKTRLDLRKNDDNWCDFKANECICYR